MTDKLISKELQAQLTWRDFDRGTGRSTILALELLAKSMRNPCQWIPVVDHHPTQEASRHLADTALTLAEKAGLDHFHVQWKGSGVFISFGNREPS